MRTKKTGLLLAWLCLGLALVLSQATAQDPGDIVYKKPPPERLEQILKGLNINFNKVLGKKDGIYFYDYERHNYKIRLHYYAGDDLWIDALFTDKVTLEDINRWNSRAKFSRVVLVKTEKGETISLETQLDLVPGTSDNIIRQYINRFDSEIQAFVKFLNK